MEKAIQSPQVVRFATFEVDLRAGELRKGGLKLKLSGQPFQVLAILLERPGVVVTREELQKRLWPDTSARADPPTRFRLGKLPFALVKTASRRRGNELVLDGTQFGTGPIHRFGNAVGRVAGQILPKCVAKKPASGPFCLAGQPLGALKELLGNRNGCFHTCSITARTGTCWTRRRCPSDS